MKGPHHLLDRSLTLVELDERPAYFKVTLVNIGRGERGISNELCIYYLMMIAQGKHSSKGFTSVNLVIILSLGYGCYYHVSFFI